MTEGRGSIIGLCAISASTLIVEIVLTKFLSLKLFHHMTFAILSMVILMLGAAGTLCYCAPKLILMGSSKPWDSVGKFAAWYSIALGLAIPIFCVCPSHSLILEHGQPQLAPWSLPLFFFILSIPFFFAGICISQTLTLSKQSVAMVYCCDLLAAAIGVAMAPWLLIHVGGYATIAFAAALGLVGAISYWTCSGKPDLLKCSGWIVIGVASALICLFYPNWATQNFGADVISPRDAVVFTMRTKFGGAEYTHWNAVARVDVSRTGTTSDRSVFKYGFSPIFEKLVVMGRLILLDGSANTRQFRQNGKIEDQMYLGSALWGSPYIANNKCQDALVIGGGGGLDILVGKYHKVPHIDVVEMNPQVSQILKGQIDDPDGSYSNWLQSDPTTSVSVFNDEGRHFLTTVKPGKYGLIQASGVDTLTAIQTGGMSLVENYLYTIDAVRSYVRGLKPEGVLSLTHWRITGPNVALRMFFTYLAYLDSIGVKDPWNHVFVIATDNWTDSMLKVDAFTHEDLVRLRAFAAKSGHTVLFDPESRKIPSDPLDALYVQLGFLPERERLQAMEADTRVPFPVTDDKPYFYCFRPSKLTSYWVTANSSNVPVQLMLTTFIAAILLLLAPMLSARRKDLKPELYLSGLYFSICGFAFLLYETSTIQQFAIFVGGPVYSLSVVLVAILAGYSAGSFLANRVKPTRKFFLIFAAVLPALFVGLFLITPVITSQLLYLELFARLALCGFLAFVASLLVGVNIATAMTSVRDRHGPVVAWMWGISSIFNALGAICFVAIAQAIGISSCLILVAIMYLAANLLFAFCQTSQSGSSGS